MYTFTTYHSTPQGTLVTDTLFAGTAENTKLLMVNITSAT